MAALERAVKALMTTQSMILAPVVTEITLQCSDGIRLAAQRWHQAPGPSPASLENAETTNKRRILCLHGWMDNCRSFHYLAPFLVQNWGNDNHDHEENATIDLVAVDLPGHGWSSHKSVDGPPMMVAEAAFYVAEAVRELQWNRESTPFTLIGHSMGAAVGCLYSASFPEQVSSLVLLEGLGPLARNPRDVAKHVRQHVQRRQQVLLATDKAPRVYPSLDAAIDTRCQTARTWPGNQWLSTAAARELVVRGSRPVPDGVQFRHDPRLQWPSLQYFTLDQTEALYQDIQCPTGVFSAVHGWPFEEDLVKRALDLLKPVTVTKLPGSHHFHADPETADRVAEEVLSFLRQNP